MDKAHPIRLDMESKGPILTVDQFILVYQTERAKARKILREANRYQPLAVEPSDKDYHIGKRSSQREKGEDLGSGTHSNRNEAKKAKRQARHQHIIDNPVTINWEESRCDVCGRSGHIRDACYLNSGPNPHKDRNQEYTNFHKSAKGKQWIANTAHGPYCNAKWFLDGTPREVPKQDKPTSKFIAILCSIADRLNSNKPTNSDFLPVFVSLPTHQALVAQEEEAGAMEVAEEILSPVVKTAEEGVGAVAAAAAPTKLVQALLDTGCLVGDCISQQIVDSLNAHHLVVNIKTTICSGYDNQCSDNHPSLLIKISFIHF